VVTQIVPPIIQPGAWMTMPVPGFSEQQLMGAERQVGDAVKELESSGARLQSAVFWGAPAQELLRMAEEDPEVELVVVGRSGKGAIARALLGSVSGRLAQTCTRPVMVIP
jgi:nucleotide-binding universal stress UspA family protein